MRAAYLVEEWSGIALPADRLWVLESELGRISPDGTVAGGLRALEGEDLAVRSRLVAAATIGETYFFRHHGHYELLSHLARERLGAGRAIRILSAGCATGEEAWSAAATVLGVVGAPRLPTRLRVEGWDLDPRRIAIAQRGAYSAWSARRGFHGHDHYFSWVDDRWIVRPTLRPFVHFRTLNLVADEYPKDACFDVIFFRNVSIYWRNDVTERVFSRLLRLLADDGVIFVGPSDPITVSSPWFAQLESSQRTVRRRAALAEPAMVSPQSRGAAPSASVPRARSHGGVPPSGARGLTGPPSPPPPAARASSPPAAPADSSQPLPSEWQRDVMALANAGRYARALELLSAESDTGSAEASYLEGVLLLNLDRVHEAAVRLRRAVYLAPDNKLYRRWLATALEAAGRTREAAREYRNLEAMTR